MPSQISIEFSNGEIETFDRMTKARRAILDSNGVIRNEYKYAVKIFGLSQDVHTLVHVFWCWFGTVRVTGEHTEADILLDISTADLLDNDEEYRAAKPAHRKQYPVIIGIGI